MGLIGVCHIERVVLIGILFVVYKKVGFITYVVSTCIGAPAVLVQEGFVLVLYRVLDAA
jgi:hypothetical protein